MSIVTQINYQTPALEHRSTILSYLQQVHEFGSEYTFSNIFLWAKHYGVTFAIIRDMLVIRSVKQDHCSYAYPIGANPAKPVIEQLLEQARQDKVVFGMHGLTAEKVQLLEQQFPGHFTFTPERDTFDYIYRSEDLITLKGKKYHGKRNHINRFETEHPDWFYEPITSHNMQECLLFAQEWLQRQDSIHPGLTSEYQLIQTAFRWFDILGLVGGLLRVDGKVVAFSLGEPINQQVFVVHIEKAYPEITGAYPMINREFIKHEASSYEYINREEDLGIEGLRKAKLSYRPAILLEKYRAGLSHTQIF